MELYIFRHGIAEDAGPGMADSDRALTEEGKRKTADVVRTARRAGTEPSLIISSPYKRAVETARIAMDGFRYRGELIQTQALVPHGSPEDVWNELKDYRAEPSILLAGHEPLLSHLVAHLLSSPALRIEMKKACMVRIDFSSLGNAPHGTLRWMIHPRICQ
jgi:phosphohistidine phosphatase